MSGSKIKNLLMALLFGGLLGLLAQIIWAALASAGLKMPILLFAEMAIYVVIGLVLYVTGMLDKMNAVGGAGMLFPLIGLAGTLAGNGALAKSHGLKGVKALWEAQKPIVILLGKGLICAVVAAALKHFVIKAPLVSAAAAAGPMVYVYAFLLPGIFSALAQLLLDNTKVIPPMLLLWAVILGEIFSLTRISNVLNGAAMGAYQVQIMALGDGMTSGLDALLSGDPSSIMGLIIALIVILVVSPLVGIVAKKK